MNPKSPVKFFGWNHQYFEKFATTKNTHFAPPPPPPRILPYIIHVRFIGIAPIGGHVIANPQSAFKSDSKEV